MEIEITQPRLVDVRYIKVDAGVRYWQDTTVNGERDIDFCESKGVGTPKIPFAVKVKDWHCEADDLTNIIENGF